MKLNKNGWQVKSLSEVAEIVTGGTPSTAIKEYLLVRGRYKG